MHLQNKNLYGNCQVLHPDGALMFRCTPKRSKWYLDRNLAKVIQDYPLIIQLTFEPNGHGNAGSSFYTTERKNECVVCASQEELTKHHCVPYCYRRYFPDSVKTRSCHDIVLLCETCHRIYEKEAFKLKFQLAVKYGLIQENNPSLSSFVIDEDRRNKLRAIGSALALIKCENRIPIERKEYLMENVKSAFGSMPIEEVAKIKVDRSNPDFNHGQSIVEKITDIADFVKMWREHFLSTMNPKFLTEGWDVNHKLERIKNETIFK